MANRWHKTADRLRDEEYVMLTAASRGVLAGLDELLSERPSITANVSVWALWLGLDRRIVRDAFEAIETSGLLTVSSEARGKEGTFYTVATPEQPRHGSSTTPPRVPDKSANDAPSEPGSLNRVEEKREETCMSRGRAVPASDPLASKIDPSNLFDGEFEILEGAFLDRHTRAFWQLQGEKRQKLAAWLAASKETRETAFRWAVEQSWAQRPFWVALDAIQNPNKPEYSTYPGSKVVQMRTAAERTVPDAASASVKPVPEDVAGTPYEADYRRIKYPASGMDVKDWQVAAIWAGEQGADHLQAQDVLRELGMLAAMTWAVGNGVGAAHG